MLIAYLVVAVMFGFLAGMIGYSRQQHWGAFLGYFCIGALLPIAGIVIAALSPTPPPPGMQAVACPGCNAKQNITAGALQWTCWRCHATWYLQQPQPA